MTPRQFLEQLRGNRWAPVYFFCGEEGFFHDRCRQVLLRTVPPEVRSWCVHSVDFAPGGLASLLEQAYQMPMMGPRNVFLIRDVGDFSHAAEEDYEALKGYLEKPSLFSAVMFMAEEPDRRRRFVSLLLKRAEVVEMRRPEGADTLRWVAEILRGPGIQIDRAAAETLARKLGGNLLWIQTELEKLRLGNPGIKRITVQDLDGLVSIAEDHEVNLLLRALAERNGGEALRRLDSLLRSSEPELRLLWHIAQLFRRSLSAPPGGTYPRRFPAGRGGDRDLAAQTAARNYSEPERKEVLRFVHEADLDIKSSWKDTQLRLEHLIWRIVGPGAEGPIRAQGASQSAKRV